MNELSEEVRRELLPGEQVLWSGRPRQGLVLRGSDALGIPFSLLWCGFAIFWEHSVVTSNAPAFFKLWGIPFVLVGLYMVIGRFFFEARQRARTFYAVTPERILIVSGVFSRQVKSLSLNTLCDVSLTEGRNGEGDITFGPQSPFPSFFGNSGWPGARQQSPKFELVTGAKSVYEKIREAQRGSFAT
ncbi:hypothetical protein GM676_11525 [Duganella radicis]|uniref:PH domain-containing protein n=2 Tax=Duganella radicis TaxID=551988 RepID=A0A6L6PGL6_9BURK|nr:hypothetical protein [Duganella radicis]